MRGCIAPLRFVRSRQNLPKEAYVSRDTRRTHASIISQAFSIVNVIMRRSLSESCNSTNHQRGSHTDGLRERASSTFAASLQDPGSGYPYARLCGPNSYQVANQEVNRNSLEVCARLCVGCGWHTYWDSCRDLSLRVEAVLHKRTLCTTLASALARSRAPEP